MNLPEKISTRRLGSDSILVSTSLIPLTLSRFQAFIPNAFINISFIRLSLDASFLGSTAIIRLEIYGRCRHGGSLMWTLLTDSHLHMTTMGPQKHLFSRVPACFHPP